MASAMHYIGRKIGTQWHAPLCSPRKFDADYTENKAEVTCSRCAKLLGITPAPKPESKNVKGTCACCFSSQRTQTSSAKSSGHMYHHGFERPGNGYIEGPCAGHDFLPYEKSCDGTRHMLGRAQKALKDSEAHIEHLKTTYKVCTYVVVARERMPYTTKRIDKTVLVTLVKGEEPVTMDCHYCPGRVTLVFETVRDEQLATEERRAAGIREDIKFYEKKIAEWVEK